MLEFNKSRFQNLPLGLKMKILLVITLSIFSTFWVFAQAKKVDIYALEIPMLHQVDGQGFYDIKIANILAGSDKAKVHVLPPERAIRNFEHCDNCCYSPANLNSEFYDFDSSIRQTKAMGIAKVYIFVGFDQPILNTVEQLKGKTVGLRRGMHYGRSIDQAEFIKKEVDSLEQNILLLQSKRIDAFVAYAPDIYEEFKRMDLIPFTHDKNNPIAVHEDSLVCRGVSEAFIKQFDE